MTASVSALTIIKYFWLKTPSRLGRGSWTIMKWVIMEFRKCRALWMLSQVSLLRNKLRNAVKIRGSYLLYRMGKIRGWRVKPLLLPRGRKIVVQDSRNSRRSWSSKISFPWFKPQTPNKSSNLSNWLSLRTVSSSYISSNSKRDTSCAKMRSVRLSNSITEVNTKLLKKILTTSTTR